MRVSDDLCTIAGELGSVTEMAMPMEESIRLPLLRVIADGGGDLHPQESVASVEAFFPELTKEDKQRRTRSGSEPVFVNLVRWARHDLVKQGHLYREPRGLWRITPEGRTYLEERWPTWQARYSIDEGGTVAPKARATGKEPRGAELEQEFPALRPPERLKELLRQLGDILGHHPEVEFRETPYMYDVVWKAFPRVAPPATFKRAQRRRVSSDVQQRLV